MLDTYGFDELQFVIFCSCYLLVTAGGFTNLKEVVCASITALDLLVLGMCLGQ
jgi:hypothetical protein